MNKCAVGEEWGERRTQRTVSAWGWTTRCEFIQSSMVGFTSVSCSHHIRLPGGFVCAVLLACQLLTYPVVVPGVSCVLSSPIELKLLHNPLCVWPLCAIGPGDFSLLRCQVHH